MAKIARNLGIPAEFFSCDDVDEPQVDAASFRSLTAMSAKKEMRLLQLGLSPSCSLIGSNSGSTCQRLT